VFINLFSIETKRGEKLREEELSSVESEKSTDSKNEHGFKPDITSTPGICLIYIIARTTYHVLVCDGFTLYKSISSLILRYLKD